MTYSLILVMAGKGERFNNNKNKVLLEINQIPVYCYSLDTFYSLNFKEYILVVNKDDYEEVKAYIDNANYQNIKIVIGGATRNDSVKNGIKALDKNTDYIFIHDAARPAVNKEDIKALIASTNNSLIGSLIKPVTDTIRNIDSLETLDRTKLALMSTPQFFHSSLLKDILNNEKLVTDEIMIFEDRIKDISLIKETYPNPKLTYPSDLDYINYLINEKEEYLIGHSLDYHLFGPNGSLILGGITFNDYPKLTGHSDADVIYHAVAESILGALNLGDLGTFYPDTDETIKGIKSEYILKDVVRMMEERNYQVNNLDIMVYLEKPKLKDYKKQMALNIASICHNHHVSIKAATLNKLDLLVNNKGIGAEATILLKKNK